MTNANNKIDDLECLIEAYNQTMYSNYAKRVELMPPQDVEHYFRLHNLPSASKEAVLEHMSRWGGFNALAMQKGLKLFDQSALMQRLISGRKPLPFPPPRRQGIPWYELVDSPGTHRCTVNGVIRNRRLHRRTWNELVLLIEDCPWEIVDANPKAGALLDAQLRFQFPEGSLEETSPIYQATQIARDIINKTAAGSVARAEISVHYGQWAQNLTLFSTGPTPLGDDIKWPLQAVQWKIDSA